jgi:hypothetical protein
VLKLIIIWSVVGPYDPPGSAYEALPGIIMLVASKPFIFSVRARPKFWDRASTVLITGLAYAGW